MKKLTLTKDYLKFIFDIDQYAHEYADKNKVSLAKSMDYITDQLNKYSC